MPRNVRNQSAVCDLFEVTAELDAAELVVRLITDLPLKTRVQLQITRPSREYIWTNVEEHIVVIAFDNLRGGEFRKSIDELERLALNKYRYWKGRMPGEIDGLPYDSYLIGVMLNPLEHRFGTCNRQLTGSQIDMRHNGHWIERSLSIAAPIPVWLQAELP